MNKIKGGVIPHGFIPAVEKGIKEAMQSGVVAGYPVSDLRVRLFDGSYHSVDSSEMAFKIAGSMAFKQAMEDAEAGAARADHGGGGVGARGLGGRRDRRPQQPSRPPAGDGAQGGR